MAKLEKEDGFIVYAKAFSLILMFKSLSRARFLDVRMHHQGS